MKNFSEKQLKGLLKGFKDFFDENDIDEFLNYHDHTAVDEMKTLLSYFGVSDPGYEEFSFVIALYKLNPEFETRPIKIPKKEKYVVIEKETNEEVVVRTYKNEVSSYLPIDKTILEFMYDNDEYYYYEGTLIDTDYYDVTYSEHKPIEIKKKK